jgi:hypothetical protein
MADRSDKVFEMGREAGDKYDYFMAGLAGALAGYVGEQFHPTHLVWLSPAALEAAAVLSLIISLIAGAKRIETAAHVLRLNYTVIHTSETIGKLSDVAHQSGETFLNIETGDILDSAGAREVIPDYERLRKHAQEELRRAGDRASHQAITRDVFLVLGLCALLASRLWQAIA